jgi:hypothetical protein
MLCSKFFPPPAGHHDRPVSQIKTGRAGVDGISDFDGLYSGKHNDEVQLYAFDILALDGDDLREATSRPAQDQPCPLAGPPR